VIRSTSSASWTRRPLSTGRSSRNCRADKNGHIGCGTSFRRSPVSASARWRNASRTEAVAYLEHDVLGPRLLECTRLVLAASEKTITDILGSPDDVKFRSCMTLFDAVSKQEIFAEAIAAFYPDGKDRATLEILETSRPL
jgi:uncharacterized protein (DUF1810 family)